MSIIPLTPDNFELFRLTANPKRTFTSGTAGATGSIPVFPRASKIEKDPQAPDDFGTGSFDATQIEESRIQATGASFLTGAQVEDISKSVGYYMEMVNSGTFSPVRQKKLDILRFEPSFKFTSDTLRKNIVQNVLFPHYRDRYPDLDWAYYNYHTLNFFTASTVPSDSVLIYPASGNTATDDYPYNPSDGFTFEFWLNARYTNDVSGTSYTPGTIFHKSSSYAISLVSGSSRDKDGLVDAFRIMLQLSHSSDIPPSNILTTGTLKTNIDGTSYKKADTYSGSISGIGDLIFLTSDNMIQKNKWHHVAVRWGGPNINNGTGSFVIDGMEDTRFLIQSSSIMPTTFSTGQGESNCLFIGNYFEGINNGNAGSTTAQFFNADIAKKDGLVDYFHGKSSLDAVDSRDPTSKFFEHPLNAEVHNLKIYSEHRDTEQIYTSSMYGDESIEDKLLFLLPPFFVKETNVRQVMLTPFETDTTTTDDPFNVSLSFGVGGHLINLENFSREFVRATYPRLYNLTASVVEVSTDEFTCNQFLYKTGSVAKRNLTILPCDNGKFMPNFSLLKSGSDPELPSDEDETSKFVDDMGFVKYGLISLNNMVKTGTLPGAGQATGSIADVLQGAGPEDPGVAAGSILTILNRTRDPSSNEVVFFDVSNLFYGRKIVPGTFKLYDSTVTGSDGKVKMTIRDDGQGRLYRADSRTENATWNSVGNILYEEGIAVIKSPNIPLFGTDGYEVTLTGEHNIYVMEMNIPCPKGYANSSSNPNWQPLRPSDAANEIRDEFTYITSVNLHDENLNIIARANLSQPIVKREDDRYLFRFKMDF